MNARVVKYKDGVAVVCELGHLIDYCSNKDFAGSMFEAKISFRSENDRFERLAAKCKGAGHEVVEPQ